MNIPERYRRLGFHLFSWEAEAENGVSWPEGAIYPPPGFLPITLFSIGNGDVSGLYWPIGRESEEPVVCETVHDAWRLEPYASSLEGALRLQATAGSIWSEEGEYEPVAVAFAERLEISLPKNTERLSPLQRLALDARSPAALKDAATEAMSEDRYPDAERYLRAVLEMLPEYTEALFLTVRLFRQTGRKIEAAQAMLDTLRAPLCLGDGHQKCLDWLRRLSDAEYSSLRDDPLWRERHRLTLATRVKYNDDFAIYEDAIAAYLAHGDGARAVRLRVLVGERMWSETTSFRERYGYSEERHRALLAANLRQAGLAARLPALGLPSA